MYRLLLISHFFLWATLLSAQQAQTPVSTAQTITIRMLNGKNGRLITDDLPNLWLGDAKDPQVLKADAKGEIKVPLGSAPVQELRFLPNHYADCRFKKDTMAGMNRKLAVGKILLEGVVADNLCGKQREHPTPGVLVIYVRKRTFMEGMRL